MCFTSRSLLHLSGLLLPLLDRDRGENLYHPGIARHFLALPRIRATLYSTTAGCFILTHV